MRLPRTPSFALWLKMTSRRTTQSRFRNGLRTSLRKKRTFDHSVLTIGSFDSGSTTFRTAKRDSEKDPLVFRNSPSRPRQTDRAKTWNSSSPELARCRVRGCSGIPLDRRTVLPSLRRLVPPHASCSNDSPRTGRHSDWHGWRRCRRRAGSACAWRTHPVLDGRRGGPHRSDQGQPGGARHSGPGTFPTDGGSLRGHEPSAGGG